MKTYLSLLCVVLAQLLIGGCATKPKDAPRVSSLKTFFLNDCAKGDAQVAEGCTINAGSDELFWPNGGFVHVVAQGEEKERALLDSPPRVVATDVGKVIVIYGAGMIQNGYVQPLSAKIDKVLSSTRVKLNKQASVTVAPSPRVVFGHDDTDAIQACLDKLTAPDSADGNIGGVLKIPRGHYLMRGLVMPGSIIGGTVTKTYNDIWLKGSGRGKSILENWDVDVGISDHYGIIWFGNAASIDPPNRRLKNITISDLTIRQVLNATWGVKAIVGDSSENVDVHNCEIVSGSYEGIHAGNTSFNWLVTDSEFHDCGLTGPAITTPTSAINLDGEGWVANNNVIRESGFGFELGGYGGRVADNKVDAPSVGGQIGIKISSASAGIADNKVVSNKISGWDTAIQIESGNGIVRDTLIVRNRITDCGAVIVQSGAEENGAYPGRQVTAHGTTIIRDNIFVRNRPPKNGQVPIIRLGGGCDDGMGCIGRHACTQTGLESIVISNNFVTLLYPLSLQLPAHFLQFSGCYGGGSSWQSGNFAKEDFVVPTKDHQNGYYYHPKQAGKSLSEPNWLPPSQPTVDGSGFEWIAVKQPSLTVLKNRIKARPVPNIPIPVVVWTDESSEIFFENWGKRNVCGNFELKLINNNRIPPCP